MKPLATLMAILAPVAVLAEEAPTLEECFCGDIAGTEVGHSSGEAIQRLAIRTARVRFAAQSDGVIRLTASGDGLLGRVMLLCSAEDGGGHSGVAATRLGCGAVRLDESQDCDTGGRVVASFGETGQPLALTLGPMPLSMDEGDVCGTAGALTTPDGGPLRLSLPSCPMEACQP